MKKCPKCSAEVDDNFDICWSCQYSFTDGKILDNNDFSVVCPKCNTETAATSKFCPNCGNSLAGLDTTGFEKLTEPKAIECLRCNTPMTYHGNFPFRDGSTGSFLEGLLSATPTLESFNLYFCSFCGKVELFLPGGE